MNTSFPFSGFTRSAIVVLTLISGVAINAQSVGRIKMVEDYGVTLNIGHRSNMMEGSRASLRALFRLVKRFPQLSYLTVRWSVPSAKGRFQNMSTIYDKSHGSINREVEGVGNYYQGDKSVPPDYFGSDGMTDEILRLVVRKSGSFSDLERLILKRQH